MASGAGIFEVVRAGAPALEDVARHVAAFPCPRSRSDGDAPPRALYLCHDADIEGPRFDQLRVAQPGEYVCRMSSSGATDWHFTAEPVVVRRIFASTSEDWSIEPAESERRFLPCTPEGIPVALLPAHQRALEASEACARTWDKHHNQAEVHRRAIDVEHAARLTLMAIDMPAPSMLTEEEARGRAIEAAKAADLEVEMDGAPRAPFARNHTVHVVRQRGEGAEAVAVVPLGPVDEAQAPDAVSRYIDTLCALRLVRRGYFVPALHLTEAEAAARAVEACRADGASVDALSHVAGDPIRIIRLGAHTGLYDEDDEDVEVGDVGAMTALCALVAVQAGYAVTPPAQGQRGPLLPEIGIDTSSVLAARRDVASRLREMDLRWLDHATDTPGAGTRLLAGMARLVEDLAR